MLYDDILEDGKTRNNVSELAQAGLAPTGARTISFVVLPEEEVGPVPCIHGVCVDLQPFLRSRASELGLKCDRKHGQPTKPVSFVIRLDFHEVEGLFLTERTGGLA